MCLRGADCRWHRGAGCHACSHNDALSEPASNSNSDGDLHADPDLNPEPVSNTHQHNYANNNSFSHCYAQPHLHLQSYPDSIARTYDHTLHFVIRDT